MTGKAMRIAEFPERNFHVDQCNNSEKIVKKRGFLSEFTLQHEKEIVKVCKLEQ